MKNQEEREILINLSKKLIDFVKNNEDLAQKVEKRVKKVLKGVKNE